MTLLAGEALKIAEHALGGPMDPVVTGLRCLNETGEWLVSARPWVYLRGGMEALDLTADQDYVALPSDFGAIVEIDRSSSFTNLFIQVTQAELMELRRGAITAGSGTIWGAVVYDHADIAGTSAGTNYTVTATTATQANAKKYPTPRLDIFPQPSSSSSGALLLYYTRGWRTVEEDTDTIFIPNWLEGVYLRALRIWAKGYEEEDTFDKNQALLALVLGPEWRAAVTRDGNIQTDMGVLRGGAAQGRASWRSLEGSVADPS